MAQKTVEEKIFESINAPVKLDINVLPEIQRSDIKYDANKHKYICSCCGKPFTKLDGNFHKSDGVLFQANGGYLPWCIDCEKKYVDFLKALYCNNEEHAIKHYCMVSDWVYHINPLKASYEYEIGHQNRPRISHYSARKNLNVDGMKTYIDSLKAEYEIKQKEVITSREQAKSEDSTITASAVDRWGIGLQEIDYKNLDEHYKMLKKNNPNADANQEIFIKTLCTINLLMIKSSRDGDSDKYVKLAEQYSKTFKQAGLKTVEEKDSSNDETFCMTLGFISEYTPEEFYEDKELYKDSDHIGEYIDRHILRPMINLETGSSVRDKEFFVPETDDDYEEE